MRKFNMLFKWSWTFLVAITLAFGLAGCEGDDGSDGAAGAAGAAGTDGTDGADGQDCWDLNGDGVGDPATEDLNGDGNVDVLDCSAGTAILIGDGSELTEEEIEELGKLQAIITGVTVASPPVVSFTVTDAHGNPALGIDGGTTWFTFAKLVPNTDPDINGGLPYWQSYVNRTEDVANNSTGRGSDVLDLAVQATTDADFGAGDRLVETAPGVYEYTFGTDVTNVTTPIAVAWEPSLTHRVGMEIRLDGEGEVPLAPDNPVFDFVPDGGAGSGVTKNILETDKCNGCHYEFAFHGGPRKTMDYCVTCHNPGTVDQDSGESLDMAAMLHSVHMGEDRAGAVPYIIWGFSDFSHDYSEVTYPQSKTYCETCHTASAAAPDGDNWNLAATAKTCGGCHANGLLAANFDAVTGQAEYQFDHSVSDVPALGAADDGSCGGCHLGTIATAGDALSIHSSIAGDDRARAEAGDNFVFQIRSALNVGPGLIPTVRFRVTDPDGVAYDILNDPEFDLANNASLNLYVQWSTDDYYGGDENGLVLGARQNDDLTTQAVQDLNFRDTGYPFRMRLGAIQAVAVPDVGPAGTYDVPFFQALPADFTGDVVFGLGGHPAWQTTDQNGDVYWERAAAVSDLFFRGAERVAAFDSAQCNACHNRLLAHGSNRNGNVEFCLMCHNADAAVCDVNPLPDGSCPVGETMEGYGMALMIHSIHSASTTWLEGWAQGVTYPQNVANCDTCHKDGSYDVARTSARAVSTDHGADIRVWTDDIATTPNSAACGACHNDIASAGHFNTNGGQVGVAKSDVLTVGGLPNGQEACAVCHGTGSTFATETFHNPGIGE